LRYSELTGFCARKVSISSIGYRDQSNVLWAALTGTVIRQFLGAGEGVYRPVFSPDGRSVLGRFTDGHAELWRIDTLNELIASTYANRYVPELTCDQRDLYHLTPACDASNAFPTMTPNPTSFPLTVTSTSVGG
jgi:WD40 repeat protein